MENFVTYSQAKAFKELGFEELSIHYKNKEINERK